MLHKINFFEKEIFIMKKEFNNIDKMVGIGLTFGIIFGIFMDNLGLGIGLGLAIGAGIGSVLDKR